MKYQEKSGGPKFERYRVSLPEYGTTEVVAVSRENAILNACREWGINWGLYACDCTATELGKAEKRICARCGCEVYTAGDRMCNRCRGVVAAQKRDFFQHYPIRKERA